MSPSFNKKIVLASGSPRRKELLAKIVSDYEILSPDIDESCLEGELPDDYVRRLAREKAAFGFELNPDALVLGADTIVVLNGDILGKPKDKEDAEAMLQRLSGQRHEVLTGYALRSSEVDLVKVCRSSVTFKNLSLKEINSYVSSGEPLDKAGSYGIQGLGKKFILKCDGLVSNVMGLPVEEIEPILVTLR